MRQHLACVRAAARISNAQVEGDALGSAVLRFTPGAVQPGHYRFDVGSAGSALLVLQTVLPPLLLAAAPSQLTLVGGTHNPMAPPFHFIERAFVPLLRRMGADVQLRLLRHGFFPAGGGEIEAALRPSAGGLRPLDLVTRDGVAEAYGEALSAGIARSVSTRGLAGLAQALGWSGTQLREPVLRQNEGPGHVLMATLPFAHHAEVFTEFGERGRSAEQVAQRLAEAVRRHRSARGAVGEHLADQLALPLALAGEGRYTATVLSEHARTNFAVIERFLPVRFRCEESPNGLLVSLPG
jgi:RNA 3'-terminal phosphate cyclase (ATP)